MHRDDGRLIEVTPEVWFTIRWDQQIAMVLNIDAVKNWNNQPWSGCTMSCWCDGEWGRATQCKSTLWLGVNTSMAHRDLPWMTHLTHQWSVLYTCAWGQAWWTVVCACKAGNVHVYGVGTQVRVHMCCRGCQVVLWLPGGAAWLPIGEMSGFQAPLQLHTALPFYYRLV